MKRKKVQGVVLSIQKKYIKEKFCHQKQSSFKYGPGGKFSSKKLCCIVSIIESNGKKNLINMKGYKIFGNINKGDEILIHKGKEFDNFLYCKKVINKSDNGNSFYLK